MNVGQIIETTNEEGIKKLTGKIATYSLDLKFELVPNDAQQTADSPSHIIIGRGLHGNAFQAGSAWAQTNPNDGQRYFSMVVNIPEISDRELRYAAFKSKFQGENATTFDIIT